MRLNLWTIYWIQSLALDIQENTECILSDTLFNDVLKFCVYFDRMVLRSVLFRVRLCNRHVLFYKKNSKTLLHHDHSLSKITAGRWVGYNLWYRRE
ncbi:unnamed protein product [Adineta ricciae]|uniref:Uncharacterized protein n=1 Tax=Adineta ricciae TaxID=249248 RepID=A0A813Y3Q4_ADIRI|nr:unnamed protein product [Adineta ricciae]